MSKVTDFLNKEEEQAVIKAIVAAENETSGEIRVHIEKTTSKAAYDRALEVFVSLKMDQTALKNGVLIYIATADKTFAICGDKGINDVVADNFWNSTKEIMAAEFLNGNFKQGLISGILKTGEQLKKYFPNQEGDVNELSNEISIG